MGFLVGLLSTIGSFAATLGSQACYAVLFDEPECPKSLIK